MRNYVIAISLFFSFQTYAQDTLTGCLNLNFENIEDITLFEGLEISNQFEASFGLSFELEGGGFPVIAEVGGVSPFAFGSSFGPDTPNPIDAALIGNWFLTDDGIYIDENSPPIILNFSTPIDSFSGCILDMDGGEIFFIEAFGEFGDVILQDSIEAGDPNTGDGRATCWGFSFGNCIGMVHQIKFTGTRPNSVFGLGLDNFRFCYAGISEALEFEICEGDSIEVNNETYFDAGTYEQQFTTAEGCDSLVYIVLDVFPNYELEESYTICDGTSIIIDDVEYDESGTYPQMLQTVNGCDSLVTIQINTLPSYSTSEQFEICSGGDIEVNGQVYTSSGSYTQLLEATNGCDSSLNIVIEELSEFETIFIEEICEGDSFEFNNETFDASGFYEFAFISSNGCDSVSILDLQVNDSYELSLNATICENETYEFDGVVYAEPGTYTFEYESIEGCDSTLVFNLDVLPTPESFESYTIFEGESIIVNGEEYFIEDDYIQVLVAGNGCDSLLNIELIVLPPPNPETIVYYDLENCSAGNGYQEMTASYPTPLDCIDIDASIISRTNGFEHSCTDGVNGGLAMCVSSMPSCTYNIDSDFKLSFELDITPEDGKAFVLSEFSFFEKAPETFTWIGGGTGPNNYPTLYGIQILWNGTEIFTQEDENTNLNWTEQIFDFTSLPEFRFEENGTLTIELLPYCTFDNSSTVTAWDVDELSIKGYCSVVSSNVFGRITSSQAQTPMSNVEILLKGSYGEQLIESNDDGFYAFGNLIEPYTYQVEAQYDKEHMNGVTTLDLVLIQKHLLAIKPFSKQAQFIAADINKSNSISALDLIELRKLILGIYTEFPNNTSWRFFENLQQVESPWEKKESIITTSDNSNSLDFEGIKIGDVNSSFESLINGNVSERSSNEIKLRTQTESIPNSDHSMVHFITDEDFQFSGLQFNVDLGTSEVQEILVGQLNISNNNLHFHNNSMRLSWNDSETKITKDKALFSLILDKPALSLNLLNDEYHDEIYLNNEVDGLEIASIELVNKKVEKTVNPSEFNVFPNPTKDVLTISFNREFKEELNVEVLNVHGKTVKSYSYETQKGLNLIELDLNKVDLSNGVFFIQISGSNDLIVKRILKL